MPRAAGSSTHYEFVLRRGDTGKYMPSVAISLPSVTSIISATLAKPHLVPWTYRETRDRISGLVSVLTTGATPEIVAEVVDLLCDSDMLEEYMEDNKLRTKDTTEEASERGTAGHAFLEKLGTAALDPAAGEETALLLAERCVASKSASAFDRATAAWWILERPQVVASESILVSLKHGFVGTVDLIWRDTAGALGITDLKTRAVGKGVYESDCIQTGGYKIAWEEMTGMHVDFTSVLIAQDDGSTIHEQNFYPDSVFLALLDVYKALHTKVREVS